MKHWAFVVTLTVALFLVDAEWAHAGGRGGGTGGAMNKLSGPGPFFALGGQVGAPFMCFVPVGDDCDDSDDHTPWLPLWADVTVLRFWGESDFDGTNVDGWTLEPSVEWGLPADDLGDAFSYTRLFASLGVGLNLFHGDDFENFWRSSINGRVGYKFLRNGALRGAVGFSHFLTPFTHGEFGSTPDANDKWVWSFQITYLLES